METLRESATPSSFQIAVFTLLVLMAPTAFAVDCTTIKPLPVSKANPTTLATPRAPQSGQTWTAGRAFDHVITVVFENQDRQTVTLQPYFAELAKQGASFTQFTGSFHPSYSNYLAMIGGKYFGMIGDEQRNISPKEKTIVDLLEAKGLAWNAYAENYPGKCFLGKSAASDLYQRKHVPFLSFRSITGDKNRCAKVLALPVPALDQSTVPEYVFVTPNMCNDGHDKCGAKEPVDAAADWLRNFLDPWLSDPAFMKRTLIIVTFDESKHHEHNHIYTVFLGGMVKPGEYGSCYDHYNVLRTIEDNFGLGTLNAQDKRSSPITAVWKTPP